MIAGRYTLLREVGRGGSGSVHLARDEVLGRLVAAKRIGMMPGATDPDLARAEREARLSAALNHPHVVSVFDLVEEGDFHWLVMEYVDGETLAQRIASTGAMDPRDAASVLHQAADALTHAHAAGILHRDVKPSNILLTDGLTTKLGDFGIARGASDASLTQTGLVTGSPAYLAPEVASGSSATQASDVWSLGATLFHAASGKAPYDTSENLMATLYKIVNEPPPQLPADHPLAPIVAVTLERDPARRWTMGQVRDALGRAAHGDFTSVAMDPVPPPTASPSRPAVEPPPASARPRPAGRKMSWGWVALATVAAVAASVIVLVMWLSPGDGTRQAAGLGATPSTTTSPPEESGDPSPTGGDAAEARQEMSDFVTTYLSTVTEDPRAAYEQLTRDFQKASGGFGKYKNWWGQVESATVSQVVANAANQTVGYSVEYVMANGSRRSEQVILRLERRDDTYLIAGEA